MIEGKTSKNLDADEFESMERKSKRRLTVYCKALQDVKIKAEPHLGAGTSVVDEILRLSRELKASMIILGTSNKGLTRELLLGSVSHRVAELSELPTLLVP